MTQKWPGQKSEASRRELRLSGSKQLIYCDRPSLWVTPLRNTRILINKKMLRLQLTHSQIKISVQMCLLLNTCVWHVHSLYEINTMCCQLSAANDTAGHRLCLFEEITCWTHEATMCGGVHACTFSPTREPLYGRLFSKGQMFKQSVYASLKSSPVIISYRV